MTIDTDNAVLDLIHAVECDGFEEVRDSITSLPDDWQDDDPKPWKAALVEGIGDAIRYAQAVAEGRSYLHVQFKPGESVTFEWETGKPVEGEFRETVNRAIGSLLDGRGG